MRGVALAARPSPAALRAATSPRKRGEVKNDLVLAMHAASELCCTLQESPSNDLPAHDPAKQRPLFGPDHAHEREVERRQAHQP